MTKKKLFCFPYAGGAAMIYNQWPDKMDSSVTLVPIELATRGKRLFDPLYENVEAMIDDAFEMVTSQIDGPYALFGHSMGAKVAYLLTQKIREKGLQSPEHVFFSGRGAPHIEKPEDKKYSLMNDEDFKEEVKNLGGTPPEFFDHPELLDLFMPTLRNDFRLSETKSTVETNIVPLDIDFTIFLGKEEDVTAQQCYEWIRHTNQFCDIKFYPGGHFFLHDHFASMIEYINYKMTGKGKENVREKSWNFSV